MRPARSSLNSNFNFGATSDLAGAGVINFNGGSQQLNGTYSLSDLNLSGSSLTSNIALNVAAFNFLNGTFTSAQPLNVSGLFTWNTGTLTGSGAANANGGLLLNSSTVSLNGKTLNNAAGQTTTLTGASAQIAFLNGAIFNNNGTFLAQNNNSLFNNGGGGLSTTSAPSPATPVAAPSRSATSRFEQHRDGQRPERHTSTHWR